MAMNLRPHPDLDSKPALLADSVAWIAIVATMLFAAPITWTLEFFWGAFGWLATGASWLGWLTISGWCIHKWGKVPLDRLIAWVNGGLPTPNALQPGYLWLVKRPWVFTWVVCLMIVFAPFWREWRAYRKQTATPPPQSADPSAIFLDSLLTVFGVGLALLFFLSFVITVNLRNKRSGST